MKTNLRKYTISHLLFSKLMLCLYDQVGQLSMLWWYKQKCVDVGAEASLLGWYIWTQDCYWNKSTKQIHWTYHRRGARHRSTSRGSLHRSSTHARPHSTAQHRAEDQKEHLSHASQHVAHKGPADMCMRKILGDALTLVFRVFRPFPIFCGFGRF